jgi:hypothetical protein
MLRLKRKPRKIRSTARKRKSKLTGELGNQLSSLRQYNGVDFMKKKSKSRQLLRLKLLRLKIRKAKEKRRTLGGLR